MEGLRIVGADQRAFWALGQRLEAALTSASMGSPSEPGWDVVQEGQSEWGISHESFGEFRGEGPPLRILAERREDSSEWIIWAVNRVSGPEEQHVVAKVAGDPSSWDLGQIASESAKWLRRQRERILEHLGRKTPSSSGVVPGENPPSGGMGLGGMPIAGRIGRVAAILTGLGP
jgi:hypothetical protein